MINLLKFIVKRVKNLFNLYFTPSNTMDNGSVVGTVTSSADFASDRGVHFAGFLLNSRGRVESYSPNDLIPSEMFESVDGLVAAEAMTNLGVVEESSLPSITGSTTLTRVVEVDTEPSSATMNNFSDSVLATYMENRQYKECINVMQHQKSKLEKMGIKDESI